MVDLRQCQQQSHANLKTRRTWENWQWLGAIGESLAAEDSAQNEKHEDGDGDARLVVSKCLQERQLRGGGDGITHRVRRISRAKVAARRGLRERCRHSDCD